jgi:hypothetical protein
MRHTLARAPLSCFALVLLAACTGLAAGPEVSAVTPVPASRDSAWVRAKRALTAEVFTLDVQDSLNGRITAMRYPSANYKVGTPQACRVGLALAIAGTGDEAKVSSTSRWLAPEMSSETNAKVCEQERQETLDRILAVVAPPPPAN